MNLHNPELKMTKAEVVRLIQTLDSLMAGDPRLHNLYVSLAMTAWHRNVPTGFCLPFGSADALEAAAAGWGYTRELLIALYQAGLLDRPREDGRWPAVLHVDPGYDGDLRPIRDPGPWRKLTLVG